MLSKNNKYRGGSRISGKGFICIAVLGVRFAYGISFFLIISWKLNNETSLRPNYFIFIEYLKTGAGSGWFKRTPWSPSKSSNALAESEEVQWVRPTGGSPEPPLRQKIPFSWQIFRKKIGKIIYNQVQLTTWTPPFVNLNPLSRNPGSVPELNNMLFTWHEPGH